MNNPILALRTVLAFARIARDPNRLEVVFDLVDGIAADPASEAEFEAALRDPRVAEAARTGLRLPALTLSRLGDLPPGSVGERAGRFFRDHGLDPADLPRRPSATDVEWLSAHLYETHDLWHVVTGFGPDIAGELGLQAFYAAQLEGPVALAILTAGMINTLIYAPEERRRRLAAIARGWTMGERAESLVGLDWGALLDRPLGEVRESLNIVVAPEEDAIGSAEPRPVAA